MIAVMFEADARPEAQQRYLQLAAELNFAVRDARVHSPGALSKPQQRRENSLPLVVGE